MDQDKCARFFNGELSPQELYDLCKIEPELMDEFYRELSKDFREQGIFETRHTADQVDELISRFHAGTLTDRQREIFIKFFPAEYLVLVPARTVAA